MLRGGISEPRNRNLFKMFNLIGIGEHAGSGVPDIFDIWKNEGLKEPQVKEQFGAGLPDRTTMILPLMEAEADISEKSQAKSQVKSQIKKADQMERRAGSVLNVLRAEPTATTPKIAIMLGITERQVRTVLDQMKDQQILRFERHGRSGRWIINDSKTEFSIPENVYIIGMMNTADRSLAMMDYALRRRFGFFEIKPGFEADQFRAYRMGLGSEKFDKLIACVESLNNAIVADESLGEGFCIGHSYFCNLKEVTDRALNSIVEFELIPLLKEYWFDEPLKVKDWISNLRSAIK